MTQLFHRKLTLLMEIHADLSSDQDITHTATTRTISLGEFLAEHIDDALQACNEAMALSLYLLQQHIHAGDETSADRLAQESCPIIAFDPAHHRHSPDLEVPHPEIVFMAFSVIDALDDFASCVQEHMFNLFAIDNTAVEGTRIVLNQEHDQELMALDAEQNALNAKQRRHLEVYWQHRNLAKTIVQERKHMLQKMIDALLEKPLTGPDNSELWQFLPDPPLMSFYHNRFNTKSMDIERQAMDLEVTSNWRLQQQLRAWNKRLEDARSAPIQEQDLTGDELLLRECHRLSVMHREIMHRCSQRYQEYGERKFVSSADADLVLRKHVLNGNLLAWCLDRLHQTAISVRSYCQFSFCIDSIEANRQQNVKPIATLSEYHLHREEVMTDCILPLQTILSEIELLLNDWQSFDAEMAALLVVGQQMEAPQEALYCKSDMIRLRVSLMLVGMSAGYLSSYRPDWHGKFYDYLNVLKFRSQDSSVTLMLAKMLPRESYQTGLNIQTVIADVMQLVPSTVQLWFRTPTVPVDHGEAQSFNNGTAMQLYLYWLEVALDITQMCMERCCDCFPRNIGYAEFLDINTLFAKPLIDICEKAQHAIKVCSQHFEGFSLADYCRDGFNDEVIAATSASYSMEIFVLLQSWPNDQIEVQSLIEEQICKVSRNKWCITVVEKMTLNYKELYGTSTSLQADVRIFL